MTGSGPRTLLLAVDALPFRVAQAACDLGAFAGWPAPSAVIAPFPSVTHVAFASLFLPLGASPSPRYELRYFDTAYNTTLGGGPLGYAKDVPPWCELLDAPPRSLVTELAGYVAPKRSSRAQLEGIEREVLTSSAEVVVAYLGATDGVMHLYGDEIAVEFLADLDERLGGLRRRHRDRRGRDLRVVLFSDHGCGRCKIRHAAGFDALLRDAGLEVVDHLDQPADVVAPRFGLVNYGALFLHDPQRADAAARAVADHRAVELAAFAPAPDVVEVRSGSGRARVRWRGAGNAARYRYEDLGGDPLRLAEAVRLLTADGAFDSEGYAADADWFHATAFGYYPDALRRLALALTGDRVASRASVLFSLGPCWAAGLYSAVAGAWARTGRLEGTHGGLDHQSSLGFMLTSDPALGSPRVVRADAALAPVATATHLLVAPTADQP